MMALTTIETSVLDIAHLVGVAAVEHLVDEPLIVGRSVARTALFKPLPVIDKDLFEDVPVPRRLDEHQITPSEGVRCWGCGMFTTSHPLRPPLIGLHRDMRIHLPRPGVVRVSGSRKMKNPSMWPRLSSPFTHFFLPSLLFFKSSRTWGTFLSY